jgi:miniconductance mechanosensitive channel
MLDLLDKYQLESDWLKLLVFLIVSLVIFFINKIVIIKIINNLTKNVSNKWSSLFINTQFFNLLSWIIPTLFLYNLTSTLNKLPPLVQNFLSKGLLCLLMYFVLRIISNFLYQFNEIYSKFEMARNRPIKGIIQIINIVLFAFGIIFSFSIILDKSPIYFISGLGAMTAILLLIFRDTILSLVAGIQITTNNLVRMGDWIELPQFGADGDVIDIALHAVKVQNWDKTITVIPTHKFLEHSFKNWRGMEESGGRRIKRALNIDLTSIRFLTEEEIDKFQNFFLLKDYILNKKSELKNHNEKLNTNLVVNSRRLTNIGTFRAYLKNYIAQHPEVNQNMILMVRQLPPTETGLPLEIYLFVKDIRWVSYEQTQSDIFDHIIAISSEFGLNIFQSPSSSDIRSYLLQDKFEKNPL